MSHKYENDYAGRIADEIKEYIRWKYINSHHIKITVHSENGEDLIYINFESCPKHWIAKQLVSSWITGRVDYWHNAYEFYWDVAEVILYNDEKDNLLLRFITTGDNK